VNLGSDLPLCLPLMISSTHGLSAFHGTVTEQDLAYTDISPAARSRVPQQHIFELDQGWVMDGADADPAGALRPTPYPTQDSRTQ
jgi:hypothetical protein